MPKEKSTAKTGDKKAAQSREENGQERQLDEALEATFPASDPITVGDETSDELLHVRKERQTPPLDVDLVEELARKLRRTPKDD